MLDGRRSGGLGAVGSGAPTPGSSSSQRWTAGGLGVRGGGVRSPDTWVPSGRGGLRVTGAGRSLRSRARCICAPPGFMGGGQGPLPCALWGEGDRPPCPAASPWRKAQAGKDPLPPPAASACVLCPSLQQPVESHPCSQEPLSSPRPVTPAYAPAPPPPGSARKGARQHCPSMQELCTPSNMAQQPRSMQHTAQAAPG